MDDRISTISSLTNRYDSGLGSPELSANRARPNISEGKLKGKEWRAFAARITAASLFFAVIGACWLRQDW